MECRDRRGNADYAIAQARKAVPGILKALGNGAGQAHYIGELFLREFRPGASSLMRAMVVMFQR